MTNRFESLVQRVREGDEAAAADLMEQYEPFVRRAIRMRMRDKGMRQILDSVDISQSVMGKFFVKLRRGEVVVDSANDLIGLLVTMAQNRLLDWQRHSLAECRDRRRTKRLPSEPATLADGRRSSAPNVALEEREIVQLVRERLSTSMQRVFDLRCEATPWQKIAEDEHQNAEALRSELRRGLRRIAAELGLDK
ncbi:MAG: ECF-type sigma factor [Planctomycetota bacterium]